MHWADDSASAVRNAGTGLDYSPGDAKIWSVAVRKQIEFAICSVPDTAGADVNRPGYAVTWSQLRNSEDRLRDV